MPEPIEIKLSGPLLTGRAPGIIRRMIMSVVDESANYVLGQVQANLNASIKHPTPYYETQVMIDRSTTERSITDQGVIYGPWLEGVGSRNRTTRFKGYHSFRKAVQDARREVPRLIVRISAPFIRELGGR